MKKVLIVGAGPAGLMAAEVLSGAGLEVHVFDAMPSVGRKFLLAGKGGLNLTHSEPPELFVTRYGKRQAQIAGLLHDFDAQAVRAWASSLSVETFVGTSGRVFPVDMKAAPLLRAWLRRTRHPSGGPPVQSHMRHRWSGASAAAASGVRLVFDGPQGAIQAHADAALLALGGGSWARLGSDGAWVPWLQAHGVAVTPLLPANCGFDVQGGWSEHFVSRFAGQPFKSVALHFTSSEGVSFRCKGEFVATASGVEGMVINTYHLMTQPGTTVIKAMGGVGRFMNWPGLLVSDSGGFQLLSMVYKNAALGKINKDGVIFYVNSQGEKRKYTLTPEKSIHVQFVLRSDIVICLDDCPAA